MKPFAGFPARSDFTPVPAVFYSLLLPEIDDIDELKITLQLFRLLYPRKGFPRYVTLTELMNDANVGTSLKSGGENGNAPLTRGLEKAVKRGAILSLQVAKGDIAETIYLLNTAADREALEKIREGEISLTGLDVKSSGRAVAMAPPNVYTLYENNIGILTPLVAEELKDAEKNYPVQWIEDAIREAVNANKRNWRYIARILERWQTEGKKDGTYRRDLKKTDPDKYSRGEYGHLYQR
ncbi:MAG: DnaD domain protein [Dehalococcoidales bacterium]|nr:DnaD domain protein [Dehalococcoidales bacterium]